MICIVLGGLGGYPYEGVLSGTYHNRAVGMGLTARFTPLVLARRFRCFQEGADVLPVWTHTRLIDADTVISGHHHLVP